MHHQELATVLLNYHIGRFVLGSLFVGDLVRFGLSSTGVLQPATRILIKPNRTKSPTHTETRTKRCGNSTAQSQAPDDGYINVRNMLST